MVIIVINIDVFTVFSLKDVTQQQLSEIMTLTRLKSLSLATKEKKEFNISLLNSFKNMKILSLTSFVVTLHPIPLLNIKIIRLKEIVIQALDLELIFKSPYLNFFSLDSVDIIGDLNYNISFYSLESFELIGNYKSNQLKIVEALEGSAKTLQELSCDIEIPSKTLQKFTELRYLMCIIPKVVIFNFKFYLIKFRISTLKYLKN
jgi:hypothetical protein